ncbi:hypothetical protein PSHI8_21460 [Polynucleobacter sp. SHI8]|uniref:hypothetical protein n=1 Tax=unclassified Polynucleobacter TaxID=2640945 RepID=UPI002491E5C2|nr:MULTISPECIES: hypothetical protein [unclassified Polynucleobacter]BDW12062.1 hypothetical protein PSHI2_21440 [Polynucleobacter sp. SHI2]BDW14510.1 hypothetical protein PSHI8_21460 [Polynucleobacter sp. SHI8]
MKVNNLFRIVLGILISTNVYSQTQSFRCIFNNGIVTNWDTGKPISKNNNSMPEIIFDQIDIQKGKGRFIGNLGSEDVQVLKGEQSFHIFERTPSGNLNITTIFYPTQKFSDMFPVVHSRHINLVSGPFPSQYVGLCKKLN